MRHPIRKAGYSVVAMAMGGPLLWFGARRLEMGGEDWLSASAVAIGGTLFLFAAFYLVIALFHARGVAKLLAGRGVIARWHVAAADWDRFRGFDQRRGLTNPHYLLGELWIRKATPPEGIDVIVGETSLLIDHSYHVLRPRGVPDLRRINWLDGAGGADCLEFLLTYPRGRGTGVSHTAVRVPVPAHARAEARRAYAWFEPLIRRASAAALSNPLHTPKGIVTALLLSLAALAGGWVMAESRDWTIDATSFVGMLPLLLLVAGAVTGFFFLIVALFTFLPGLGRRDAGR